MQWPPTTMATQHPDNARVPWWKEDNDAFISTHDEITELITLFRELPIDEYMWDWEGKYVDEAVGEKIYSTAKDLFDTHPLGQDLHLTFRIPALESSKTHRMARAMMNVLSLTDLALDLGIETPPVHELFLPLTVSADQLIQVHETFLKVAEYHRNIFHDGAPRHDKLLESFAVTPLVEDTDSMFTIENILGPYWKSLKSTAPRRVFLARSDPALNAGLVPAVLAIKSALSTITRTGESMGFAVHPIIGTGSLPFRGSVNPLYTDTFLNQYAGVRTYSIQSAFRYDYEMDKVKEALSTIKEQAPQREVQHVSEDDRKKLRELADIFTQFWKPSIEALAPLINRNASLLPRRRERLQHIGLFGYSRGTEKVKLPRAITFTGALYSIGIPPELVATGRGLREAKKNGLLPLLETYYPALPTDLEHAGKYFNRENLEIAGWNDIQEDIAAIEEYLGKPLGPKKPHHMLHRNLTSTIYLLLQEEKEDREALSQAMTDAAVIRRSIG